MLAVGCVGTGLGDSVTIWDILLEQRGFECWMLSRSLGMLWKMCGKSPSKGDPLATAGAEIKALGVEFWFKSICPGVFWDLSPILQATTVPRTFQSVL